MSRSILVRGARQLLSLRGPNGPHRGADLRNLGIVHDGAILIVDGVIREVGPTRRLENLAEARQAEEIDANGCVVLPGFVDSHTHLIGGPARLLDYEMGLAGATRAEIATAGGGFDAIYKLMQDVSGHTLEAQATRVLEECIRQGTTTLEAKSGYGFSDTGELKILRAQNALNERFGTIVSTFMVSPEIPRDYGKDRGEYINWVRSKLLPIIQRRRLARFVDIACDERMFSLEQASRLLLAARTLGFGVKMHAGEHGNIGAVKLAVELWAVSLDHVLHVDESDIRALAGSPTMATLLPGPVFYQGAEHYAPARILIDQGVAVAIATNYNPETCPTHNMQMIISLACSKMNMTPAEAISAATINGAHALGMGDRIGSLEVGKEADVLILDIPDYREIPYHFGVNLVRTTIRKGRRIYQASEVQWPS
ncbi:MAG: imidazolonepropionase [Acidobacteriota bacterium]|nr:imidazolonepropionase [Acidobacteriota bacterium]